MGSSTIDYKATMPSSRKKIGSHGDGGSQNTAVGFGCYATHPIDYSNHTVIPTITTLPTTRDSRSTQRIKFASKTATHTCHHPVFPLRAVAVTPCRPSPASAPQNFIRKRKHPFHPDLHRFAPQPPTGRGCRHGWRGLPPQTLIGQVGQRLYQAVPATAEAHQY